jgi:hypothetical protein
MGIRVHRSDTEVPNSTPPLWMGLGGLGALALGVALIPLRSVTTASNLAFAFLILTMVSAELGGRATGLVVAVVSALSLNFFLTTPYLTLHIDRPDDLIAFVALAATGLVAAAFGRRWDRTAVQLGQVRHELDVLDRLARRVTHGGRFDDALEILRKALRLGAVAVRTVDGRVVAHAPPGAAVAATPTTMLDPTTLLEAAGHQFRLGQRGFRLPEGGGRMRLPSSPLWLDLWEGDPDGLTNDEQRVLTIGATMLGLALQRSPGLSGVPDS